MFKTVTFSMLISTAAIAEEAQCWGVYDPAEKEKECVYYFLSDEDKKVDQYIRDNFTAFWTRSQK